MSWVHYYDDGLDFPDNFRDGWDLHDYFDHGWILEVDFDDGPGSQDDAPGDGWGLEDNSGDGLVLQDDSGEGFGSQSDYDYDRFVPQDDYHDLFGLLDDFARGFGLHDESFGTQSRSIVDGKAKKVETSSVFLQQKGAKRIKHYCSTHNILLVGEGDFSFSACLAKSFGCATNMVATSLDSYDFILSNYGSGGWFNLLDLKEKGCKVIHEVDATIMADHGDVGSMAFDIIVFNFPHAGFKKFDPRASQLKRHRKLVRCFFENAKRMLSIGGEIHVVHKTNGFFGEWRIEELASECGLHITEKTTFELSDYPGYQTKYGFGGNKNFNCYPSMTYKFELPWFCMKNGLDWVGPSGWD